MSAPITAGSTARCVLPGTPRTPPLSPLALCSQQDWTVTVSKDRGAWALCLAPLTQL